MAPLRFCAYQYQHLSLPELTERWRAAEDTVFETVCHDVIPRMRAQR
jgi:hypothetical protein